MKGENPHKTQAQPLALIPWKRKPHEIYLEKFGISCL